MSINLDFSIISSVIMAVGVIILITSVTTIVTSSQLLILLLAYIGGLSGIIITSWGFVYDI